MRTIMERTLHDSSFSFSRRYFNWRNNADHDDHHNHNHDNHDYIHNEDILTTNTHKSYGCKHFDHHHDDLHLKARGNITAPKAKHSRVSKLRSFFTKKRTTQNVNSTLGSKTVIGTLFGYRRGHVHIAFQEDSKSKPAFLIELSTPTSVLVKEMASGLVRVALECDKQVEKKGVKFLMDEPLWRAYCNGKKCGYAMRRDCGSHEKRLLGSIGPITMGAGVLPGGDGGGEETGNRVGSKGEIMYMRAKFERVVGSNDSEAFYMLNPDRSPSPELSVYLLRV